MPNGLLPSPSYRPASPAGRKAKAAWAVTLAQYTGKRDIVIAQAVNGHLGATVHAAGFCLNTLPVRVSLADLATGQDLLDCVQQQYFQSLPFDGVDYADILKQCAPWPVYHPGFSVVIHQNYSLEEPLQLDGVQCPLRNWTVNVPRPTVGINTNPGPAGQWNLRLATSTGTLDQSET